MAETAHWIPREQLEREWTMYRDEVARLQERLEMEREPWIAEIRSQMAPRIEVLEKERDALIRLYDIDRRENIELRNEIKRLRAHMPDGRLD